ncbi:glycosyltransferase [candidate division KSB1 bacterium]|nr:glycosyltransferase [candidate division KSB1 bacterium]
MKRVLFVSYYFPPLGMGGIQRIVKFVRYLPEYDWHPVVLTVKPVAYWAYDPSLERQVKHAEIARTDSLDPQRLLARIKGQKKKPARTSPFVSLTKKTHFLNKILSFIILPDTKILWWFHAIAGAKHLYHKAPYDAIVTSSPPHSVHLIGRHLATRLGIPWIADFRDQWAGGVVSHEPTFLHRKLYLYWQRQTCRHSDARIAVTPEIGRNLEQETGVAPVTIIRNGYDPNDFYKPEKSKAFIFCHCGSITRFANPVSLLDALQVLRQTQETLLSNVQFKFLGMDVTGTFQNEIDYRGLQDLVSWRGYRSHDEAMRHLCNSDALILLAKGEKEARFVPGKVYEYLGSQKPILALTNVKDTCSLLKSFPGVWLCDPEDQNTIQRSIMEIVKNKSSINAVTRDTHSMTRQFQTQQLAMLLNQITG